MPIYISQASTNPVSRVLGVLVALLALAGAFFFGLIILVVISGLGLLLYVGMRLRMWWIMRHAPAPDPVPQQASKPGDVIDAEYTVISTKRD
jgi:hypothetical protein